MRNRTEEMRQDRKSPEKSNAWKSTWKKVCAIMAAVVVFATTYALILPALTLESESGDATYVAEEETTAEAENTQTAIVTIVEDEAETGEDASVSETGEEAAAASEDDGVATASTGEYTLSWTQQSNTSGPNSQTTSYSLTIYCVDEDGNLIGGGETITVSGTVDQDSGVTLADNAPSIDGYTYSYAVIATSGSDAVASDATQITAVRYNTGSTGGGGSSSSAGYQYGTTSTSSGPGASSTTWSSIDEYSVYMVYMSSTTITIECVDENDDEISDAETTLTLSGTIESTAIGNIAPEIDNYNFSYAYLSDDEDETKITNIKREYDNSTESYVVSYSTDDGSTWVELNSSDVIVFVYEYDELGYLSGTTSMHVDVKESLAYTGSSSSSLELTDVTQIVITTDGSSSTYTSSTNPSITVGSGEWNLMGVTMTWDSSLAITFEYVDANGETQTAVAYLDNTSVYAANTYYPADGENADKLRTYLGITDTTSPINISGMNIYLVALILCDGSSVSYGEVTSTDGFDFALDVNTLLSLSANWTPSITKNYYGDSSGLTGSDFTFVVYDATLETNSEDSENAGTEIWTITTNDSGESEVADSGSNGSAEATDDESYSYVATDTFSMSPLAYSASFTSSDSETITNTYYYIVTETSGTKTVSNGTVTYDDTVYGVKVVVSFTGTTSSATYTITVTYYKLTSNGSGGYTVVGTLGSYTKGDSTDTTGSLTFDNYYTKNTSFELQKVDQDGDLITSGEASFILYQEDSGGNKTYYNASGSVVTDSSNYTLTTSNGKLSISNLSDGTYILEETEAPDGYNILSSTITITVKNGAVTSVSPEGSTVSLVKSTDDEGNTAYIVKVVNTSGDELPNTGGPGTNLLTFAGLLLMLLTLLMFGYRGRARGKEGV